MKQQIKAMKSVRKSWDFVPTSRVVPSKKKYSRKEKFNRDDN